MIDKEIPIQEKSNILIKTIYENSKLECAFHVFLNKRSNYGKIYLPLSQSLDNLINNTSIEFDFDIEIRDNKIIIYF